MSPPLTIACEWLTNWKCRVCGRYPRLRLHDFLETLHDILRRRVSGFHDALDFLAALGRNLHPQLFGVCQKLRITQDSRESVAQCLELLSRHLRRHQICFAESLLETHHQHDRFAVNVVVDVLPGCGDAERRQLRLRLDTILDQEIEFLLPEPLRLLRLERRPVETAHAIDLAPLHGDEQVWRAFITTYNLKLGSGRVLMPRCIFTRRASGGS